MFDLEPGILVLIGIGLALITIILVAVGYSMARILDPAPEPGPDSESAEEALEEVTQEFEAMGRRRDRAGVIGYLAAGISHDFNNMLFVISGRIQMLKNTLEDEPTLKRLDEIHESLKTTRGVLAALQEQHAQQPHSPKSILVGPELREISEMMQCLVPSSVQLDLALEVPDDCSARITHEGFQQIVVNLLLNARTALEPDGGRILVELRHAPDDENEPGAIQLVVEDDGPGIPDDRKQEVFLPFNSTRTKDPGAGLGLPIIKQILSNHGGRIQLDDAPSGGLRATVVLRPPAPSMS